VEHRKALVLLYDEKKQSSNQLPSKYDEYPETTLRLKESTDIDIANHHLAIFIAYFKRGLSLSPSDDPEQKIYIPEDATAGLWKVLEMKPNSIEILRQIHKLIAGRKCEEFITWCDKLIKFRQDDSEVYFIRGMNYQCLKDYRQSIGDISKAIKLNPNVADYYEKRAFIYCSIGIINEGIQDFSKAIELNPASANLYFGRGLCGTNRQEWQRIDDVKIAARLGLKEAQDYLKNMRIEW
jgi:tetratricopeptide (TPR) repeat protein